MVTKNELGMPEGDVGVVIEDFNPEKEQKLACVFTVEISLALLPSILGQT